MATISTSPVTAAAATVSIITRTHDIPASEHDLHCSAAELVQAVVARHLTLEELRIIDPDVSLSIPEHRREARERPRLAAEECLNRFYAVFTRRVTSLNVEVNSPEFPLFAVAIRRLFNTLSRNEICGISACTLPIKMISIIQEFDARIFDDMLIAFARQPLEFITIASFRQKADLIGEFFRAIDMVDIEMRMRQAIKAYHRGAAINNFRAQFADSSAPPARIREITARLTAERAALETELSIMRGPNGSDGTYAAAAHRLAAGNQAAQAEVAAIQARFAEIAQYTGSNLTGGRLYEIIQNLDPARLAAQAEAEIMQELSAPLVEEKAALEAELNAMRGPNGFDGTFNAAAQRLAHAEAEKNDARVAFLFEARQLNPTSHLTEEQLLALLTVPVSANAFYEGAKRDYIEKVQAFNTARQAHDAIQARFAEIAVYTGSDITGGRLFEVNQNLDPARLAAQVRAQATRTADFYKELNQVVTEDNKIVRSRELNRFFE